MASPRAQIKLLTLARADGQSGDQSSFVELKVVRSSPTITSLVDEFLDDGLNLAIISAVAAAAAASSRLTEKKKRGERASVAPSPLVNNVICARAQISRPRG